MICRSLEMQAMFDNNAERNNGLQGSMQASEHGHEVKETDGRDSFELLSKLLSTYDYSDYPDEFIDNYVIMECLAEHNGADTFVVQDGDGERYVAKCYDRMLWSFENDDSILCDLSGTGNAVPPEGFPKYIATYSNSRMLVRVREYIEGMSLDKYAADHDLSREQITDICMQLCDILAQLHHREAPVIHRDIKPQNIIVRDEGEMRRDQDKLRIALIDFDIARVYNRENDTDTRFFGTVAYAPPEQYGFSQTDARADIYSLGVLLRFLLTGSTRENKNISVYKPLAKIIEKCTAFSPADRYSDIDQVKKALSEANPGAQRIRITKIAACCLLAAGLIGFTCSRIYKALTWSPFNDEAIPAYTSDSERIDDAVAYMNGKFDTDLFSGVTGTLDGTAESDSVATIGLLKRVLIDCYGLDADYVNAPNTDMPHESDDFFLPWTWDDSQTIGRDTMVYVAVKLYDPERVADWSSLEDDNGEYPGARVAISFAEETGIMTGANRPDDITVGEMALILANTDRVFTAAEEAG